MSDDGQIGDILSDYYERRNRGESSEPGEILDEQMDPEGKIRENLAALRLLEVVLTGADEPEETSGELPREIGKYRILREIGRGGMGVVYEAEQIAMHRRVALKVLSPAFSSSPQAVERFEREARAAGRLNHTNIASVYSLDRHEGHVFYTMELVECGSLADRIDEWKRRGTAGKKGSAHYGRLAEMFARVADALAAAHGAGIIHRDVKPANLLLARDGTLKIVDFGMARLDEAPSMTIPGEILGTPIYMSPEQITGKYVSVDQRTDVYSLGATLYEAVALQPPFHAVSVLDIRSKILNVEPRPLRALAPHVPRDLETIVSKAMTKEREDRYRTARAMSRDLLRFAEGVPIQARPLGPVARTWRTVKRHRVRSALTAAVAVLVVVGGMVTLSAIGDARRLRENRYKELLTEAQDAIGRAARRVGSSELDDHPLQETEPEDSLNEAIGLFPDRPEAWWLRAFVSGRNFEERLADVKAAGARGLDGRTVGLLRGYIMTRFPRGADAREVKEARQAAIEHEPDQPEGFYAKARVLSEMKMSAEAITLLDRAITTSGSASLICYLARRHRARLRLETGDLEGALKDLFVIQQQGDQRMSTRMGIASAWRRLGKPEHADRVFQKAIVEAKVRGTARAWRSLCREARVCGEEHWRELATREAVARWPDDVQILLSRADALHKSGELDAAVNLCGRVLAKSPNHRAYEILGSSYYLQGEHQKAEDAFTQALSVGPRCCFVLSGRGASRLGLGRVVEALVDVDEAIALNPDWSEPHANKGAGLYRLGRLEESSGAFRRACELDPGNGFHHLQLGDNLLKLDRPEEASMAFRKAVDLEPDNLHYRVHLSGALLSAGKNNEVLRVTQEGLRVHPASVALLGNHARALWLTKRLDEAEEFYRRALKLHPRRDRLGSGFAMMLLERDGRDATLKHLQEALERSPASSALHVGVASVHAKSRRWQRACASYREARKLNPRSSLALQGVVESLHQLRRNREALELLPQLLEQAANDAKTHQLHGQVLMALARWADGVPAWRRAAELDPGNFAYHANLGAHAFNAGDFATAEKAFGRAIAIQPESRAIFFRGRALQRLHCYDEARQLLEEACRRVRESPPRTMAKKRLYLRYARYLVRILLPLQAFEEALAVQQEILEQDPKKAQAIARRGLIVAYLGRVAEARTDIKESLDLAPSNLNVLWYCMEAQRRVGDHREALSTAKILFAADSAHRVLTKIEYAYRRARCLRALGRHQEAQQIAASAVKGDEPSPELRLEFAFVCAVAGEADLAKRMLEAWNYPWHADDLFERAGIHAVLGERDAAIQWLGRAAEKGLRRPVPLPLDAELQGLTVDPRFEDIVQKITRK